MLHEFEILNEVADKLEKYLGPCVKCNQVVQESADCEYLLNLHDLTFVAIVRRNVLKSNLLSILDRINAISSNCTLPVVLVGDYISPEASLLLTDNGINYADIAGNCHIKGKNMIIHVSGEKRKASKEMSNSSFTETGIRLIFFLLENPENVGLPYRDICNATGISLGSIKNILEDMKARRFIFVANGKRRLMNVEMLTEQWQIAYNSILKPKIFLGRMDFIRDADAADWRNMQFDEGTVWGGEPAANIIDGRLYPDIMTIYTDKTIRELSVSRKLRPSGNGKIHVYRKFWNTEQAGRKISPLLVYADLMGSGDSRCLETAKYILR